MDHNDANRASMALGFLVVCPHPLLVSELSETTILDFTRDCQPDEVMQPLNIDGDDRLMDPADIISILGPFATLDQSSGLVQLAHHSVRTYLIEGKAEIPRFRLETQQLHYETGVLCLKYVLNALSTPSDTGIGNEDRDWTLLSAEFPLLTYAAKYFSYHIYTSGKEADAVPLLLRLFSGNNNILFRGWLQLLRSVTLPRDFYVPGRWSRRDSALYHTVSRGLTATTVALFDGGGDVNEVGGTFRGTLLHAACWMERSDIVRLLLDRGVDYYAMDKNGDTAYGLCLYHRNTEIRDIFK